MRATIRYAAAAFTTGAVIALALDAVLQFLTATIRIVGGVRPPWYARVADNGVWIALGLVLWLASPLLAEWMEDVAPRAVLSRRSVWELVGLGMLTLPAAYVLSQWIVLALQLTSAGTWLSEGGIFVSSAYYGAVLLSITPWMGAGAVVRGWAHHMLEE
jgi:hypothetical protein